MYRNIESILPKNHFLDRSSNRVLPVFYLWSTCVLPFAEGSPMLCKIEIRSRHAMLSGAVVNIG